MPRILVKMRLFELKKVRMANLLQAEAGFSLSDAKCCVDRLLEGDQIEVEVTDARTTQFAGQASELGTDVEVVNA